jgi:beta-mannosidase
VAGPDAVLSACARRVAPDRVDLTVSARRLLLWVHPEVSGWIAEDEYFHLAPGETRTVSLRPLPAPALVPRVWRGLVRAVNLSAPAVIQYQET